MDKFLKTSNLPQPNYIGSQVTLNVITAGFIGVRFVSNYKHARRLFADDCKPIEPITSFGD
jgi:hypothetical protein